MAFLDLSTILITFLSLAFGYLIGSIFISYPIGLLKGIDITESGTGQLGGSNAGRLIGWYMLPIAGLFDIFKSYLYLFALEFLFNNYIQNIQQLDIEIGLIAGSVGLILGHDYSVYTRLYSHKWHGGKGMAPIAGIVLFISWQGFLIDIVFLFLLFFALKKLLKTKLTVYDNFYSNAIQLLLSPFILYFFVPELWIVIWLVVLIILLAIIERKKIINLIKK